VVAVAGLPDGWKVPIVVEVDEAVVVTVWR